jgi:O-glycosyl hydrolase
MNMKRDQIIDDLELKHFSIDEDRDYITTMIKDALKKSEESFKTISSPWTAPPWMKDNKAWKGGSPLPEFYDTDVRIFGYDQNRDHLEEWVDVMFKDEKSSRNIHINGQAIQTLIASNRMIK